MCSLGKFKNRIDKLCKLAWNLNFKEIRLDLFNECFYYNRKAVLRIAIHIFCEWYVIKKSCEEIWHVRAESCPQHGTECLIVQTAACISMLTDMGMKHRFQVLVCLGPPNRADSAQNFNSLRLCLSGLSNTSFSLSETRLMNIIGFTMFWNLNNI